MWGEDEEGLDAKKTSGPWTNHEAEYENKRDKLCNTEDLGERWKLCK